MDVIIKPLTPERVDDYLRFFGERGFIDHEDWAQCYCLNFCLSPADDEADHSIEASLTPQAYHCHRIALATAYITQGKLCGYLAYDHGTVIGWCNANDRACYPRLDSWHHDRNDFLMSHDATDTMAVTCFLIDPDHRGQGVASALLDRVVADAATNSRTHDRHPGDAHRRPYVAIEGYPRDEDPTDPYDFTGPKKLYLHAGFTEVAQGPGVSIMRKSLR